MDCMVLLKCLLSGRRIPSHFYHYINALSKSSHVTYEFEIRTGEDAMFVQYEVELTKNGENNFCLSGEKTQHEEIKRGRKDTSDGGFRLSEREKELFRPLKYYSAFERDMESMVALGVAQQTAENFNEEKQISEIGSFLFSKKAQEVFGKAQGEAGKIFALTKPLQNYGLYDLAVIENAHYGLLALNLDTIPVNVDWPDAMKPKITGIMLKLTDINVVPKEIFRM